VDHPGADGVVRDPVDEDEAATVAGLLIGLERDRAVKLQRADTDLVEFEAGGCDVLDRVDDDLVLEWGHRCGGELRPEADEVAAPGQHRLLAHPDDRRLELVRHLAGSRGVGQDVAAADVHVVDEREGGCLAGHGHAAIAVIGDDPLHGRLAAGGQDAHAVARSDLAARDRARDAAEVRVGALHELHRQSEGPSFHALLVDLDTLQVVEQRRAGVPAGPLAAYDDVVTQQRGHRDASDVLDPDPGGERAVVLFDLAEARLRVTDQIDLVDGQRHVGDTEQRDDVAVAPGLGQHRPAPPRRTTPRAA
jgi:hypothetical protein